MVTHFYSKYRKIERRGRERHKNKSIFNIAILKFLLAIIFIVGLSFVAVRVYSFIGETSFFKVDKIEIEGNEQLTKDEILIYCEIPVGTSLIDIDTKVVENKLKRHPYILNASAKKIPFRRLIIKVEERKPIAMIQAGSLYEIDKNGMILPPINSADIRPNLPIITGVSTPKVQIGECIREIPVRQALKMIEYVNSLPPPLPSLISEVNISNPSDMVIYTADEGIKVHFGNGEYIDKITFLKAVLNDVRARNISVKYLDMRYKDQIIVARDK